MVQSRWWLLAALVASCVFAPWYYGRAAAPIFGVGAIYTAVKTGVGTYAVPATLSAGKSAGWSALATGIATTLGAVSYFAAKDSLDREIRIPIDTTTAQPIPAPAADATTAEITYYSFPGPSGTGSGWHTTKIAACAEVVANITASCSEALCPGQPYSSPQIFGDNNDRCGYYNATSTFIGGQFVNTLAGCPPGYSLVSGTCTLANARQATPDARRDVKRVGNTYEHEPDADGDQFAPSLSGGTAHISGTDSYGNAITTTFEATENGTTVTQRIQTTDAQGNPTVTTKTIQFNTTGQPVSTGQTTQAGTLTQNPTTQAPTVTPAGEGTLTGGNSPCAPGTSGEHNCEETQQQIKEALTKIGDDPSDPTPKTTGELQGIMPNLGWAGWSMPSHSAACPTISLAGAASFFGTSPDDITVHCSIIENQREVIEVAMAVVWLLVVLFVVLSA